MSNEIIIETVSVNIEVDNATSQPMITVQNNNENAVFISHGWATEQQTQPPGDMTWASTNW